jgi:hypothetical protein
MKFQPGDKVRYLEETCCGLTSGHVYTVSKRSVTDTGIHLVGFEHLADWWLDRRFELYEEPLYVVLTQESREIPSGAFNPRIETFTKAQKFTREELQTHLEKLHKSVYNPLYEVFKLVPVKVTVRSTIEVEE